MVAVMTRPQARQESSRTPGGRKKYVAVCALAFLIVVGVVAAYASFSDSGETALPSGDEYFDLMRVQAQRPDTGTSIVGHVTINKKIPLPRGFASAYLIENLDRVAACSEINSAGVFRMENVPPGRVVIIFKQQISDPTSSTVTVPGVQTAPPPKTATKGGPSPGKTPRLDSETIMVGNDEYLENQWRGKQPKRDAVNRVKFGKANPHAENDPVVRWLVAGAFLKYGSAKSNESMPTYEIGEGVNHLHIDLVVR